MRKHPRYPVSLEALILTPDGRKIPAVVTDLSTGGAGVETAQRIDEDLGWFTLVVTEPNFEMRVECEARQVRELWRTRVIHAQFIVGHNHGDVEEVLYQIRGDERILPFPVASSGRLTVLRRLFRRRVA